MSLLWSQVLTVDLQVASLSWRKALEMLSKFPFGLGDAFLAVK